ncbi:RNA replicase polyprotein [Frankliniella fusca]|uniref:RNA replicase polyprotein n=1 Tax=Frankliniella fusca TaxID=407009 RepID=A0AAE1HCA3_9NEOP|nr:RNA replicase polyprotein [Frankliniella fusca]
MEENAREFKETFGYEIPAFDVVYCMQQSMDKEEDGNHKNEVELEKQNSSASSDSYSPSSSSLSSSDSDLSPLPTKRKATPSATRSKRQPSKARRSLEFGLTNTSSLSLSQTHSAGRGKVISEGSQSTSPEASVTLRTEKMVSNEKPGSLKKAMSAPSKNATSSTSEKSVGRHQGHHLFRSTSTGVNNGVDNEAFQESAGPFSNDIFQGHMANDKPPNEKAQKQGRKEKASLVEPHRPERRRVRDVDSGKTRNVTWHYFLEVDGQKHQVCKSTFLDTLCLSETFVRNIQKKKRTSQGGIIPDDARGNHKPVHVLPAETEEAVMKHINSFPSYVSHYSRSQTKSLYFPSNLSYKKMYKLYKQADNPYVSYSVYKKLAKKTGKKFKKPSKDTCGKCDKLKIQINVSDGEVKRQAEIELEIHQRKAEEAYATKRRLKEEALNTDNMALLVYDLEQCLPTPMLRCGESYYTRQLNTFNLTVYDTKSKLTYCYMWNEVDGGRSANAIASCLLRHILEYVPEGVERLILFSDACTSQNRNSHISAMYFVALQEHASLKSVEHMFLVSGHTHMEPDNKHSVIERYKKNLEKVNVPQEWYDAVEAAGKQNHNDDFPLGKFKVILMKDNFYDFSALLKGPLVKREKTVQNEKFSWLDTFVFHYSKERLGIVQVKSSHNPAALFEDLSFIRVGGRSATIPKLSTLLKECYTTPQPISLQKKRDLLKLLPYVDAEHHGFYHALTTTALEDTDPDLPEED